LRMNGSLRPSRIILTWYYTMVVGTQKGTYGKRERGDGTRTHWEQLRRRLQARYGTIEFLLEEMMPCSKKRSSQVDDPTTIVHV
jgi:hypothetical protein